LKGQPVIGVNPLPERYDGILVPHPPEATATLLDLTASDKAEVEGRTMVEAVLDDRQRLLALNEVFIGHRSHQSARYKLRYEEEEERQSSSGIIVATGTGATGWARSLHLSRHTDLPLPEPEAPTLAFFVREAFPSRATGTEITEGLVDQGHRLEILSEMNEGGVVFGDGIEDDRVAFGWGQRVEVRTSETCLNLVRT
jgi:hypothetical protein